MPWSTDKPPDAARKYSEKCQRAFVHAANSVLTDTHDEGRAVAAGHAAAKRCEGKRSSMTDGVKFNFVTGILKTFGAPEDGIKRLSTTASSTIRDLSGDTMTLKALQRMAQTAEDNMTIFLNHKYQVPEDVLGSVEKATIRNHAPDIYDLDFVIRVDESNERAVKTWSQIQNGTKLGCSIGALIPEGGASRTKDGLLIEDVHLLEASVVGIPANPRSFVQYATKAYADAEQALEEEGGEAPFPGAVWDTKARVWVTIDSDSAEAGTTTSEGGKPKKGLDEETPESTTKAQPEEDDEEEHPVAGEGTTQTDETAGPEETSDSADGEKEAAAEQPDSTDVPATQEALVTSVPESVGEDDDAAPALLAKTVEVLQRAVATTTQELVEARKALADETQKRADAERQLGEATQSLRIAKEIVERIAALPIGRRTGFSSEVSDFRAKFTDLYSDDVIKLLEK